MGDWMMLASAVCGALAAGVLVAYGICLVMFAAFRMHAKQVTVKTAVRVAGSTTAVEG